MQQVTLKNHPKRNFISLSEILNSVPCERCSDLNNFNKCDPIKCDKLEDLAINLGGK